MERLLSLNEAAALLHVSKDFLYRRVARKEIPFIRFGRAIRFSQENIKKFVRRNSVEVEGYFKKGG